MSEPTVPSQPTDPNVPIEPTAPARQAEINDLGEPPQVSDPRVAAALAGIDVAAEPAAQLTALQTLAQDLQQILGGPDATAESPT